MIAPVKETISLFACLGPQLCGFYSTTENRELAKILQMEYVTILASSLFAEYSIMQDMGAGCKRSSRLRHHDYFIPSHVSLKDVTFSNKAALSIQPSPIELIHDDCVDCIAMKDKLL